MEKRTIIPILLCLTILALAYPQFCQGEPQIKTHRIYHFYSTFASPLVIINNKEQEKHLVDNTKIYIIGGKYDFDGPPYKHPKIDFKQQCLIILNAPSSMPPKVNKINYLNNVLVIDVEYSEYLTWDNGDFRGTGILIDRPNTEIKLSEKTLKQHEKLYGKKLHCYRKCLDNNVDKKLMEICNKIYFEMFNDIYRLKRQFNELKDFNENNINISETKDVNNIFYRNQSSANKLPELLLNIAIEYPLHEPYKPGILGPDFSFIIQKEYENICAKVHVRLHTKNNVLKNKLLKIIKKRLAPLDKLNNDANLKT